jgi:hypothetical protein
MLAIAATAGCGGGHKVSVGSTSITTSSDDNSTTVKTDAGSVTIGKTADTSKLGAPVYPGATQDTDANGVGGGMSLTTADGTMNTGVFKTPDSFDKVYAFYTAQLPNGSEKMKISNAGESVVEFQIGAEGATDQVTVGVSAKDNQTTISITHVVKNAATGASAEPAASSAPASADSAAPGEATVSTPSPASSDGGGS